MQELYIKEGIGFKGPLAWEEIKLMKLSHSSLIWHAGLPDWTAVSEIEELKDFLKPTSNDKPQSVKLSHRAERKKIATVIVTAFTIAVLLAMIMVLYK